MQAKWVVTISILALVFGAISGAGSAWSTFWVLVEPHAEEFVVKVAEESPTIKALKKSNEDAKKAAEKATKAAEESTEQTKKLIKLLEQQGQQQ